MSNRILLVDDEAMVLRGLSRQLSHRYDVETALCARDALDLIRTQPQFAVVMSDMRMPGLSGVDFLREVRELSPESTRMLLTGYADLKATISAINEGRIFRFLAKPCEQHVLEQTIEDGVQQYNLVMAEKELLEGTLRGSVELLSELLGLISPVACGRAARLKTIVIAIAQELDVENLWEMEIAAMMSHLGCVGISDRTLERIFAGKEVSPEEAEDYRNHPTVAASLLKNIPRLEHVAEIVAYQQKHFDGGGLPADSRRGQTIPLGARILKAALDFEIAESSSVDGLAALQVMKQREGRYDPSVLTALEAALEGILGLEEREIEVAELREEMVLAAPVYSDKGQMLVAKGQVITPSVHRFLRNFCIHGKVIEPLRVLVAEETSRTGTLVH